MRLAITLILFFICSNCFGQDKNNDIKNMMDSAVSLTLKKYLSETGAGLYKKILLTKGLFLMDENQLPYKYLLSDHGVKISPVCGNCPEIESGLKTGMNVWKIWSTLQGDQFSVSVARYTTEFDEKMYFSYSGNTITTFKYNCKKKKWNQTKIETMRH